MTHSFVILKLLFLQTLLSACNCAPVRIRSSTERAAARDSSTKPRVTSLVQRTLSGRKLRVSFTGTFHVTTTISLAKSEHGGHSNDDIRFANGTLTSLGKSLLKLPVSSSTSFNFTAFTAGIRAQFLGAGASARGENKSGNKKRSAVTALSERGEAGAKSLQDGTAAALGVRGEIRVQDSDRTYNDNALVSASSADAFAKGPAVAAAGIDGKLKKAVKISLDAKKAQAEIAMKDGAAAAAAAAARRGAMARSKSSARGNAKGRMGIRKRVGMHKGNAHGVVKVVAKNAAAAAAHGASGRVSQGSSLAKGALVAERDVAQRSVAAACGTFGIMHSARKQHMNRNARVGTGGAAAAAGAGASASAWHASGKRKWKWERKERKIGEIDAGK